MRAQIHLVATDFLDLSVTFAINGVRWEYFLNHPRVIDNIEFLAREISQGKALAFAKRKSVREERVL